MSDKFLGVDVGKRHFGLALADGPLATPLPPLRITSLNQASLQLVTLAHRHGVGTIVLGLPDGELAKFVHQLIVQLQNRTSLPIVTHPETLSTREALDKLRAGGAKRAKLKHEHSFAACLILEDYLETLS